MTLLIAGHTFFQSDILLNSFPGYLYFYTELETAQQLKMVPVSWCPYLKGKLKQGTIC